MKKQPIFLILFFILLVGLGVFGLQKDSIVNADTIVFPASNGGAHSTTFTVNIDKTRYTPSEIAEATALITPWVNCSNCSFSDMYVGTVNIAGTNYNLFSQRISPCSSPSTPYIWAPVESTLGNYQATFDVTQIPIVDYNNIPNYVSTMARADVLTRLQRLANLRGTLPSNIKSQLTDQLDLFDLTIQLINDDPATNVEDVILGTDFLSILPSKLDYLDSVITSWFNPTERDEELALTGYYRFLIAKSQTTSVTQQAQVPYEVYSTESFRISPQPTNMTVGDKTQFSAYYDDNINDSTPEVDVTNSTDWSSNNSAVVSVGNAGGATWYENLKNFVQKLSAKLFAAAKNPTPAPAPAPLPAVIKGYAEAKAVGQATITATYNTKTASLNIVVSSVPIDTNQSPTVNAGIDKSVEKNKSVALSDATASDPEGDPLTYSWQCLAEGDATDNTVLNNTVALNPTFTAPSNIAYFYCYLTVTDTHTFQGAAAHNSATDSLMVTITNPPPAQPQASLRIGPPTNQMYVNQKIQFSAYFDSDINDNGTAGGDPTPETNVTTASDWSSASSSIITVNDTTTKGYSQAKSVGLTRIYANYRNPATGLLSQTGMSIEVIQQKIQIKEVAP